MVQIRSGTLAECSEDGVRLRRKTSREKHADLRGATDRDAVAILRARDRTRVPELVPVRYERMLANPFAFLRGAAVVMAEDLRREPTAGIPVQRLRRLPPTNALWGIRCTGTEHPVRHQ
jgi:Uncharacterized protein conserved in bacteria (DUF2252)